MSIKTQITSERLTLVAGVLINKASLFIFTIALARTLGPELMGIWQTAILVASYGSLLTLGVVNGMGRDVPYFRGAGDMLAVRNTISTTFWTTTAASILTGLAILIILLVFNPSQWLTLGCLLLIARAFNAFGRTLLRSFQDFKNLGLYEGLSGLIILGATMIIIVKPSLTVAGVGYTLALTILSPLWFRRLSLSHFQHRTYLRLLKFGTPIMLAGTLFTLLTAIDRIVILATMSQQDLGIYTPAITALNLAALGPSIVSTYVYPKLAKEYGRTNDLGQLRPLILKIMQANTGLAIVIAAASLITLNLIVIPWLLPAYSDAKWPVAISLLASIPLAFAMSVGDLFNVIGHQFRYLRNILAAVLINGIVGFALVQYAGLGLIGVAIGSLASTLSFAALQLWSYSALKRSSQCEQT
ncbi:MULTISPECIES: oligosaccharide flippase family protein [unclassified Lentimonas]|uniref:oligosaccharide flippase family protein n=1 Tax=unclassified Lentimonas TaxID=2630993 RepID=UPI001324D0C1|nr:MULTISPECIES: oligosaccharide flippase family protein [unclassified Lentimonas]CAA6676540.1 Unannotated [Lentimonas sp. CC4]CAA6685380.1 Unannotated [Lentimonas sp. CC6]CAA7074896.1 Unannotated [Lentimonas sp. CC4]CAA7169521.1 Unannotated [Lentimonas sp. CC21]CAA7182718.1 Unannotated [Lentimonas sp. CC8]